MTKISPKWKKRPEERERRLQLFFEGIRNGKTMKEIASELGIATSSLNYFLKKNWDGKMK